MYIEFKGGPCDGERIQLLGEPDEAYFLVASRHPEKPVYRCSICPCCAAKVADSTEIVDYHFIGYEKQIKKSETVHPAPFHKQTTEPAE